MTINAKNSSLISGSLTYLLSNVLAAAIPFALLPVLTRHLSPAEYGQVAMFQALLAVLATFAGVNTSGAAGRRYYDGEDSNTLADYVGACLQLLAASVIILFMILYPLRGVLSVWLGIDTLWILVAVSVAAGNFIVRLRLLQWQVRKQAFSYGFFQVSLSLVNMALSLYLVVVLNKGAEGRMIGQSFAPVLFAISGILLLYREKLMRLSWRPTYIKDAFAYGFPLIPHVAGIFLLSIVDRFVINAQLGVEQVGIYTVAVQLTMIMTVCFDAVNKAYVPWLFERLSRDSAGEKRLIVRWSYIYFLGVFSFGLATFYIGPVLVTTIVGQKYREAGEIIGWLAVGQVFYGMYFVVSAYILYAKKTLALSCVTIFSGAVNVCLLLMLTNYMGLKGAAIAFASSMVLRFVLTWLVSHKVCPMPWFDS